MCKYIKIEIQVGSGPLLDGAVAIVVASLAPALLSWALFLTVLESASIFYSTSAFFTIR